jgi:hypothetical protein
MTEFFLSRGDQETASKFRPSSMEAIRGLGGDALTFVTEMPLFIIPGVGENIGPPDLTAERWNTRIASWKVALEQGRSKELIRDESSRLGMRPMPIADQMRLQWRMISAAFEAAFAGLLGG